MHAFSLLPGIEQGLPLIIVDENEDQNQQSLRWGLSLGDYGPLLNMAARLW